MDNNVELVRKFYTGFQQLDARAMNECYSDDIVFFDPVFELLKGDEAKAMWKMLCGNAEEFELAFSNITALDEEYYTCEWVARYRFSKTNRMVINKVKAFMRIENGKIIEHSDGFSLHKWAMQALGFSGWLFGWNRFFQRKIKNQARRNLNKYMAQKNQ